MKFIIEKVENGFILSLSSEVKAVYERESDLFARLKSELNKSPEDDLKPSLDVLGPNEIEVEELDYEIDV